MANIAIFRINYKSDFILTLQSDAGWLTPFCIKFWTGAPSQAYFAGYDGTTYTHCAPVDGEPTKLLVQFDDHHLPLGDLKYQIAYHFTVADFPTSVEDEVINQSSVIIEVDNAPAQVMLDLNGETAPEIEFSLPAYANEAQRIENEQQRIANEQQRIQNEETRIAQEETRQRNEATRIAQEEARVSEFARLKHESQQATTDANGAATLANQKAQLAADKAALADDAATLANQKAQLAADKAALANDAAQLANEKAALAQQKAEYAQQQGGYAKDQGDYAKNQGDYAKEQGDTALADHQRAEADHGTAVDDHTQAGNDHTQAGNDHTRAESDHGIAADDHTQAGNDHTRAESDHSIAADDHTQAGNDHTRAESDHTRAESDHAAVEVYVDSLGAFDISSYHATGGVLAKYADLTAALGTNGANIPEGIRKGGMSVKFVQSSDNKYVQFRYMLPYAGNTTAENTKFVNPTNWQGVDDEPTAGSDNLVKSGGIAKLIKDITYKKEIQVSSYASGWKLAGNGLCEGDSDSKLVKYAVSEGQIIFLDLEKDNSGVCQFQDSTSVPSTGTNAHLIGSCFTVAMHGAIVVPQGATTLIVSQYITNTTNKVYIECDIDEVPTANSKNLVSSGGVEKDIKDANNKVTWTVFKNSYYNSTYFAWSDDISQYAGKWVAVKFSFTHADANKRITFRVDDVAPFNGDKVVIYTTLANNEVYLFKMPEVALTCRIEKDGTSDMVMYITTDESVLGKLMFDERSIERAANIYTPEKDKNNFGLGNVTIISTGWINQTTVSSYSMIRNNATFFLNKGDRIITDAGFSFLFGYYKEDVYGGLRVPQYTDSTKYGGYTGSWITKHICAESGYYKILIKDNSGTTYESVDTIFSHFKIIRNKDVEYDNMESGLEATDVQGAIDEIAENVSVLNGVVDIKEYTTSPLLNKLIKELYIVGIDPTLLCVQETGRAYGNNHNSYNFYLGLKSDKSSQCYFSTTIDDTPSNGYYRLNSYPGRSVYGYVKIDWTALEMGQRFMNLNCVDGVSDLEPICGSVDDNQEVINRFMLKIPNTESLTEKYGLFTAYCKEQAIQLETQLTWQTSVQGKSLRFIHVGDNHGYRLGALTNDVMVTDLTDNSNADFMVLDGDMVLDKFSDSFETPLSNILAMTKPCYVTIGNHDAFQAPTLADKFNKFIAPLNDHNGLTGNTKTYYSVDYTTEKVKCIFLDQNDGVGNWDSETMNMDTVCRPMMTSEQINWFISELSNAITNSLHVAVFMHIAPTYLTPISQDWNDFNSDPLALDGRSDSFLAKIIDAFQNGRAETITSDGITYNLPFTQKGKFVAWFCAHVHCDVAGTLVNYPNQFCVCACKPYAANDNYSQENGVSGMKCNFVYINTHSKRLGVVRLGDRKTRYGGIKLGFNYRYSD